MSYIISIVRDKEITLREILDLIQKDKSLSYNENESLLIWKGYKDGEPIEFDFENGALSSLSTPDDETMEKMEEIAKYLSAKVKGEDEKSEKVTNKLFGIKIKMDPMLFVIIFIGSIGFVGLFTIWLIRFLKRYLN